MERCLLDHCEFAQGGQCCLVCPKGLDKIMARRNARGKIERCVSMLRRVHKKMKPDVTKGVHENNGVFTTYITYRGKQICLGMRNNYYDARLLREDAEEIAQRSDFDRWLSDLRVINEMHRKAKWRAKKEGKARGEGQK